MDKDVVQVEIRILGKEYLIGCPAGEREALLASARLLDGKMREIRDSGKVIGAERVAVMAGLNIAHELLQQRGRGHEEDRHFDARVRALQEKVEAVLEENRQLDL